MEDNGEDEDKKLTLLDLSDDPIYLILSQLQLSDLKSVNGTGKFLRNIIKENQLFINNFTEFERFIDKIYLEGWTLLEIKDKYKDKYFDLEINDNILTINNSGNNEKDYKLKDNYYMYIKNRQILIISNEELKLFSSEKMYTSSSIYYSVFDGVLKIRNYDHIGKIFIEDEYIFIVYKDKKLNIYDLYEKKS